MLRVCFNTLQLKAASTFNKKQILNTKHNKRVQKQLLTKLS